MPATPYATLLISVNGAGPVTGGITVADTNTIQLSGQNTTGWYAQRWDFLAVPPGFTAPAGWSTDTDGTIYSTAVTPPLITLSLAGKWGKFIPRLRVNEATTGNTSNSALTDKSSGFQVASTSGLVDLAVKEEGQFGGSTKQWVSDHQTNLRTIDTIAAGIGGVTVGAPVATLSALRAVAAVNRVDNQSRAVASPPGTWIFSTSTGAGFASDDATLEKPDDVLVGAAGRWYNQAGSPTVSTVAALRAAGTGKHSRCRVLAYATLGDGGGGEFYWDATDSTTAENYGTCIIATGVATGRWRRQYSGALNVRWFGAMGDGTAGAVTASDDTTAIQRCINTAIATGGSEVHSPPGVYNVSALSIPSALGLKITGVLRATTWQCTSATGTWLNFTSCTMITFSGIECGLNVQRTAGSSIRISACANVILENFRLYNPWTGIDIVSSSNVLVDTVYVLPSNVLWNMDSQIKITSSTEIRCRYLSLTMGTNLVNTAAILIDGGNDTVQFDQCTTVQVGGSVGGTTGGKALWIQNSIGSFDSRWLKFESCVFESCRDAIIRIDYVNSVFFDNCYAVTGTIALAIYGGDVIFWNGGELLATSQHVVQVTGGSNINIANASIGGGSVGSSGTYSGVAIADTVLPGTVATTATSGAVVGTGTTFTAIRKGQSVKLNGLSYRVTATPSDDTHMTVSPVLAGTASGLTMYKSPIRVSVHDCVIGDPDTVSSITDTMANGIYANTGDELHGHTFYNNRIHLVANGGQCVAEINKGIAHAEYKTLFVTEGAAAPTAGTWKVGEICRNTAAAASGIYGWICTTAGTPGTWTQFGANIGAQNFQTTGQIIGGLTTVTGIDVPAGASTFLLRANAAGGQQLTFQGTGSASSLATFDFNNFWLRDQSSVATISYTLLSSGASLMDVASTASLNLRSGSSGRYKFDSTGHAWFDGAPVAKQTVSGSVSGSPALASLLAALGVGQYNLLVDGSTDDGKTAVPNASGDITDAAGVKTSKVLTTDATATKIVSTTDLPRTIPSNSVATLQFTITGWRTGGAAAGTVGDCAWFIRTVAVKNVAGTLSIVDTVDSYSKKQDAAWGDPTVTLDGGSNIAINAIGLASANITWAGEVSMFRLTP